MLSTVSWNLTNFVAVCWMLLIVTTHGNQGNTQCGAQLVGLHGTFHTPNFPEMYPNKLKCIWNITVPSGHTVSLKFTEFELEWTDHCAYDYVKVKASNGTIGKFCGYRSNKVIPRVTPPPQAPIYAPDNTLEVFLHTDFSNERNVRGFEAHYTANDIDECATDNGGCAQHCHNFIGSYYCSCRLNYMLHKNEKDCRVMCQNIIRREPRGFITSPEYPKLYPPFAECDYHITAEKGYIINLKFHEFEIEEHQESACPYDWLTIEDEIEKIGPYCGVKEALLFRSHSNWLIIEFKSDANLGMKGFKAEYWLEAVQCPSLTAMENGEMIGPTNFTFKETLRFACHEGYSYSGSTYRTCLSNSTWSGHPGECSRISCESPNDIPQHAFLSDPSASNLYYYGHQMNVYCSPFYEHFGSKKITCIGGKHWSGGGSYCVKVCGRPATENAQLMTCSGGIHRQPSLKYSQPWLVAIKNNGRLTCSGILISKEWILTTSHCVAHVPERYNKNGTMEVVLGATEWNSINENVEVRKVKNIRIRNEFDYGIHGDVALVQLSFEVTLSGYIQPICLPSEKIHRTMFHSHKKVVSIGWRHRTTDKKTDRCLEIQPKGDCKKHYEKLHIDLHTNRYGTADGRKRLMPSEILCAKEAIGNSDLCNVMQGSGLVAYYEPAQKWYLGALLTWGSTKLSDCHTTMSNYSLYTRINKLVGWIKSRTNLNVKYPDTDFKRP